RRLGGHAALARARRADRRRRDGPYPRRTARRPRRRRPGRLPARRGAGRRHAPHPHDRRTRVAEEPLVHAPHLDERPRPARQPARRRRPGRRPVRGVPVRPARLDRGTPRLLPRRTPPHRRRRPPQRPRPPRPRRPRQRSRRNPLEHPLTPRQPPTPKGGAWPPNPPLGGSGGHAPPPVPFPSPSRPLHV